MDYYKALGVERTASDKEINEAYRKLAMKYHPDRNQEKGAVDKFKEVSEAFEVLNDKQKRAQYDRYGHAGPRTRTRPQGGNSFDDFFNSVFTQNFNQSGRNIKGTRVRQRITLKEALEGCTKEVSVKKHKNCLKCESTGFLEWEPCANCKGTGVIHTKQSPFTIQHGCPKCSGRGKSPKNTCQDCKGEGYIDDGIDKINVDIPPGIEEKTQLRMSGKGDMGGDLYVVVQILKHKFFDRTGPNLFCEIPVSYTQLALGDEIEFDGLLDKVNLKIKPGTQLQNKLRLKEQGMPMINNAAIKGDLFVRFKLVTPTKLSKEHKKLLEQLAKVEKKSSN
ncbi:MAG: molecular chaperone DnaJ [Candidatus Thorarchaeota archaeon]|jgi:molecular chaperone DnaJ